MRDVSWKWWLGLPLGSFILCVAVAMTDPQIYKKYVRRHEAGVLEQGTVACLVPAVIFGGLVFHRRRQLPAQWLGWWALLIAAGAFYYAGEECSWGQNYFRWGTPERWSAINDQNETNLHNTSDLLDHLPRRILNLATIVTVVTAWAIWRRRRQWDVRTNSWAWLLPTAAAVPAAAMAILAGVPKMFQGPYDKNAQEITTWYTEMFLDGRHSELKEYFLAMFMLMYLWSLATRMRTMQAASPVDSGTPLSYSERQRSAA